jgi:release factor glutamine methyltransferase
VCDERATVAALGAAGLITEVVFRHDGQLGPLLRARAEWLRAEGLLDDDRDEVIIVRAERPKAPAALGREAA